jgi:glyoxylase-like metal-dependent hydrolase (beta-lactamase superfamily II)
MEGFEVFPVGPLAVNSTILYSRGDAFIFDPGAEGERLVNFLNQKGLNLKGIFLTHGHVDHFGQVKFLKRNFPTARVFMNEKDSFLLGNELWTGFAARLGAELNPPVDEFVKEGDTFKLGNLEVEVYETPGHTPGSVVYFVPQLKLLIAGDLLFKGSVGRWDLPGGDLNELVKSLQRVFNLFPDDTLVVTGHYDLTTLGEERENVRKILGSLGVF